MRLRSIAGLAGLIGLGLLPLARAAPAQLEHPEPSATLDRPNVVLIIVDDLNTRLSVYGFPEVHTPNLERLAERGRRFDRAYSQFPICNPSRASLMSGWHPWSTGVWSNRVAPGPKLERATLLHDYFRASGYYTVRVGKVYHFEDQFEWDLAEDFHYRPGEAPRDTKPPRRRTDRTRFAAKWSATERRDGDEPDGWTARRAAELLQEPRDRPLFLAIGFIRPHGPWFAPKAYFETYPEEQMWLPPTPEADLEDVPAIAMKRGAEPRIPDDRRQMALAAYSACVSFVDAQIGVVLDVLDRSKLWDRTVVVLVGDNGIHRGEHGLWKKNSLFEVSSRVPLLIAAPGLGYRGVATSSLAELVDLYPTLLDLAGLPQVGGLEGTSLLPLLLDPRARVRSAAFTYSERRATLATSVRTDRYRFTAWPDGTAELYDHALDPEEHNNLAALPEHQALVERLQGVLREGPEGALLEADAQGSPESTPGTPATPPQRR